MTATRAARIAELTAELIALTTADERDAYPFADHLTDLLDDLEDEEDA